MFFHKRTIGQRKILKMEKTIEIKRWNDDEVIFSYTCEDNTVSKTVEKAVRQGINLSYADLSFFDLSGVDLSDASLNCADFTCSCLENAILKNANLSYANLIGADLTNTNLTFANLSYANLSNSDLYHTNFFYTNLSYANLSNTNISFTRNFEFSNLNGTNLTNANLTNVNLSFTNLSTTILDNVKGLNDQCPKEGSFIGWKKCYNVNNKNPYIVNKRSSATTNKCRCSHAKVLEIQNIDSTIADVDKVYSWFGKKFEYKVNEMIYPDSFDDRYWVECSHGIHFFINREDAVKYKF